jgi:hypothetical protein
MPICTYEYIMDKEKKYWSKWYTAVVLALVVQVVLYYLITINYR